MVALIVPPDVACFYESKKGLCPPGHPTANTEDKVKELFEELELPYDLTGVEILREYICEQGKEEAKAEE